MDTRQRVSIRFFFSLSRQLILFYFPVSLQWSPYNERAISKEKWVNLRNLFSFDCFRHFFLKSLDFEVEHVFCRQDEQNFRNELNFLEREQHFSCTFRLLLKDGLVIKWSIVKYFLSIVSFFVVFLSKTSCQTSWRQIHECLLQWVWTVKNAR